MEELKNGKEENEKPKLSVEELREWLNRPPPPKESEEFEEARQQDPTAEAGHA